MGNSRNPLSQKKKRHVSIIAQCQWLHRWAARRLWQRLVLSGGRDVVVYGKMGQERIDSRRSKVAGGGAFDERE